MCNIAGGTGEEHFYMMFDCQQREDHLCRLKLWRRRTALHRKLVSLLLLLHRSCLLFKYAEKIFGARVFKELLMQLQLRSVDVHCTLYRDANCNLNSTDTKLAPEKLPPSSLFFIDIMGHKTELIVKGIPAHMYYSLLSINICNLFTHNVSEFFGI